MKAWLVYCRDTSYAADDFHMEIVQSETRGKARLGSLLYTECEEEWTNLGVKRAKEFDGKELTPKTFIENGWWQNCETCPRHLDSDDVTDGDCFFDKNDDAYCGECWSKRIELTTK